MSAPRPVRTLREIEAGELTGSPYPRCNLFLRFGARVMDVALAWAIWFTGQRFGAVLAILYVLLADGILQGQSLGKRLFGVKVMHLPTQSAGRKRDSTLRNAPFALVMLLGMLPDRMGPIVFFASALAIGGVETWKTLRDPLGMRLGDIWAQTQVVDGKVVAGAGVMARTTHQTAERATGRALYMARRASGFETRRRQRCASR